MADVFISYAKADRSLALKLAAMLEAEGWKVWWDTSLAVGDDFRNEIMSELGRARAVVVIWTDASIKSDWVRSEAGRAQADRKLIPVKLEHLTYKELPPPFDVLHTENVGEEDKIRAAVVSQLAKPAVEPSAIALLTKGFRYELLTWVGIVGGALTLFTNLGAVLKLADWARVLVEHWKEWTHAFWVWAFSWLGIHLSPYWGPILSFAFFGAMLVVGQALQFKRTVNTQTNIDKYQELSFSQASMDVIKTITPFFLVAFIPAFQLAERYNIRSYLFFGAIGLIFPQALVILFAGNKRQAAFSVFLLFLFSIILVDVPNWTWSVYGSSDEIVRGFCWLLTACVLPLILLSVAPAKAVTRRLIFLALGLLLLVALNEISKLGLDLTAPKAL